MRTLATWSAVLLAMAGAANAQTEGRPKELSLELGGGVKLEMVLIPAGEFMMGSPDADKDAHSDEKPQHRVRITKPFYLGKYPVTQEQWEAVMGNNPSRFKGPKNPVEKVSWDDCQQFLEQAEYAGPACRMESSSCPPRPNGNTPAGPGRSTKYCFGDDGVGTGRICLVRRELRRQDAPGGREEAERLGALRHARQRLGVVPGLRMTTNTTPIRRRTIRRARQRARSA